MKFLIDAHLPRKLTNVFINKDLKAIHTLDLPNANTTDEDINQLSASEKWIFITKYSDFVNSFLLANKPWKLLLVSTGNIRNQERLNLFQSNLPKILSALKENKFIKINRENILIHQ